MCTKPIPIMKLNASGRPKALSRIDLEVMAAMCLGIGSHIFKIGEQRTFFNGSSDSWAMIQVRQAISRS